MDLQQPTLCLQIVLLVQRVTLMLVTGNLESDDIYIVPLWRHLAQISELVTIWHLKTEGSGPVISRTQLLYMSSLLALIFVTCGSGQMAALSKHCPAQRL